MSSGSGVLAELTERRELVRGNTSGLLGSARSLLQAADTLTTVEQGVTSGHTALGSAWPIGAGQVALGRMSTVVAPLSRQLPEYRRTAGTLQEAASILVSAKSQHNEVIEGYKAAVEEANQVFRSSVGQADQAGGNAATAAAVREAMIQQAGSEAKRQADGVNASVASSLASLYMPPPPPPPVISVPWAFRRHPVGFRPRLVDWPRSVTWPRPGTWSRPDTWPRPVGWR